MLSKTLCLPAGLVFLFILGFTNLKAQDPLHHLFSGESNLSPNVLRSLPVNYAYYPIEEDSILRIRKKRKKKDRYDGPDKAAALEYQLTKDPVTGRVPREHLLTAIRMAGQSKAQQFINRSLYGARSSSTTLRWIERGPNSDVVGSSNGNTRANSGVSSGRIRSILVDSTDPSRKTVWIGAVAGGLWKTTDITLNPANWVPVNDYLSNLAVTDICQDPRPGFQNIMYFCTGEAYYNADAVRGNGVFKSTDGGVTWSQLSSTSGYTLCTRILCDYLGNVYLGTRGSGLVRSTNGGTTWTGITPSGMVLDICDMEISSTSGPARLHVVSGIFSTQGYRYTDIPATVTTAGWTSPVTAFPSYSNRAEIACSGNVLYALPVDGSSQIPAVFKSTDGGANWSNTGAAPPAGWANGQGWYDVSAGINPANSDQVIIGAIDSYKSTNAGSSWTKISNWVGTSGQYVHADIHDIVWYDGGNKLIYACDGGIHFSTDGGTTIRDRNTGLRIKQFYSGEIHPTSLNYFLGGTQDNGVHQLNSGGLTNSIEVTGGDGAYVAIDQNQPQYQFGSYVYNDYRRTTNSGSSWSYVGFYKGTSTVPDDFGSFINPFDFDSLGNTLYATADGGEYFRWTTAQTTAAGDYYLDAGFPTGAAIISSVTNFNSARATAIKVSPFTANRVYFGISNGRLVRIENAHTAASGTAGTLLATPSSGSVSCINFGTTEQNMIISYSNYNINNVLISTNGGSTWTAVDGNLPNMPVRWCLFYPGNNTKAIIATEAGVWQTELLNGASTVWTACPTFPTVRTDQLKFRPSDSTFLAATHGRGMFTSKICTSVPEAPAGTGFTLCNSTGGSVTLSATPGEGETIDWYTAADGGMLLLSGSNTFTTPFLTSSATYYAAARNISTGCFSDTRTAVTATVIIISGTLPGVTASSSPTEVCSGSSATLSASSTNTNYSYIWTPGSLSGSNVTVNPSSTQSYQVTASDTVSSSAYFGCQTTASVTVTTKPLPLTPSISPASAQKCPGQIQAFSASSTFTNTLAFGTQAAVNVASTSSTGYPAPYTAYYGGQRMQILIRASELTAAGFAAGTQFNSLQFPVVSRGISWGGAITSLTDFRVRMGHTALTTLSSFQSGLTQVVNPAAFTPQVGYDNAHNFNTNFTWNGTSNIIIETTFSNNITGDDGDMVVQYNSPAGFNNTIVYRADGVTSTTAAAATTVSFTYASRPDLKLNGFRVSGINWSPLAGLYKDAAATLAYTGDTASVVYAKPSSPGSYTFTATAAHSNGCTASATASLNTADIQVPAITAPSNISVNAGAGNCFATGVSLGTPVTSDNCSVAGVTNNAPSSYPVGVTSVTWTVTDGAGNTATAIQTVTVTDNQSPVITAPSAVTVTANASNCSATGVSLGSPAASDNCSVSGVTNNAPASFPAGTTTVIWTATDASGNTATASQTVTVQSNISGAPAAVNASRCGSGTVIISATPGIGETIDWYANSSGGTALLSGSNSFTTPSISSTTAYYAQARNLITGCISGRTAVTATINSFPAAPTVSVTQPTCSVATGTITVTSSTTGLNFSTDGSIYTNTTGIFSDMSAGSYDVTARNASGCVSAVTEATVNSQPSTPSAPTVSVTQPTCSVSTGTITVTSPTAGLSFSTDGSTYTNTTGIFSGMAGGTYDVTARNSSGCVSGATSVSVNIQPSTPSAPVVSVTQPTCTVSTGTIVVTSSTAGLDFSIDGITYTNTTGVFSDMATGSYDVTARNASGCVSNITVATVNAQPSTPLAPTISITQPTCALSTGTITVTSSTSGLNFSTDGGTYTNTTGVFSGMASGSYNVTARNSSGCESNITVATVNAQPSTPSAPTISVAQPTCTVSTGTISVTSSLAGMNFSIDGITYTNISGIFSSLSGGSYNVTARNASGCVSDITVATIASQPSSPASPVASDSGRCGSGSVQLFASVPAGVTVDWYDSNSGGNLLLSGSVSFTTPVLSVTTLYYAESRNVSAGCVSSSRTPVNAFISSALSAPVISAGGPLSFCNGDSVILTSSSMFNNLWNTGDTTPSIKVTTAGNYILRLSNNGCLSEADTVTVALTPCGANLNVKLYIQGYYQGGGLMRSPLFNSGLSLDTQLSDSILIELHNPTSPYAVAASQKTVINTNGNASASFPALSGEYYIAIRHRNALETWSAWPVNITSNTSYDFTDAASKAYGNNQHNLGSNTYAFYSGDINQDGAIESQDYTEMENSVLAILFGYFNTDLTGDGIVESDDYVLMENNILNILFVQRP